ncbi:MAG: ATP synthase F1 subunit epsilon [Melioribacteraceae bacterium]|nr:ATP synthase F1 subunit epsilon [Melioribacteraceae bacterium]
MKEINLEVTTPSKKAYSGKVKSVTLPGTLGSFQVLYNHAPILSSLEIGVIKVVDLDDKESFFAVGGGTAEVMNNNVLVLAESFESPEHIDAERAEQAKKRAEERLKKHDKDVDFARAEVALNGL